MTDVIALAALLSVGDRQSVLITDLAATRAVCVAEADGASGTSRDSWFRIGRFLSDVIRSGRDDRLDRTPDAIEPRPQHVVAPFETGLPAPSRPDTPHH
jgi:hypothetical protein